jgi:DNA-binding NtrC family response regulator
MRALSAVGWHVVGAETGDEGLRHLSDPSRKIDLVLLDQLMPGISGTDTLIRIHTLYPDIPVVTMSGFTTDEFVRERKKQGAFDCLSKPFTPEQLRTMVRRALEGLSD